MSTSSDLTQTPSLSDYIDPRSSEALKEKFKDNERPTGADFANLIDASFNKIDGPIRQTDVGVVTEQNASFTGNVEVDGQLNAQGAYVSHALETGGNVTVGADLTVSGAQVVVGASGESRLTDTSLKVGSAMELPANGSLTVNTGSSLNGKVTMASAASISKAADSAEATLDVDGDIVTDVLRVGEHVEIGGERAHIAVTADEEKPSLDVKDAQGQTQLALNQAGQLSLGLPADQTAAKLHIRYRPDDPDTLLRIDDQANDNTPLVVTADGNVGIGTESPHNPLDVTGSASIGHSAPVSPDHSLSVQNRIGVGTASPMARVDVHTVGGEAAVILRDGDNHLLDVDRDRVLTDTDLTVKGSTVLEETQVNRTLNVSGDTTLQGNATIAGETIVKGVLTAKEDTQLQTVTANQKAVMNNVLVVEGDTKHGSGVGIGLGTGDNHNPSASLHIREGETKPSVTVENKLGERQFQISSNAVTIGSDGKAVSFTVDGATQLNDTVDVQKTLTVAGLAALQAGATVDQHLVVSQAGDDTPETALNVTANGDNTALSVDHHDGTVSHPILVAKVDRVGIKTDTPQYALHVSGDTGVDGAANFKESVRVDGPLIANQGAEVTGTVQVNLDSSTAKAQVHIAHAEHQPSLRVDGLTDAMPAMTIENGNVGIGMLSPERKLAVDGDARITGHLDVNNLLSASTTSLSLKQQSNDAALTITKAGEASSVSICHDKLYIKGEASTVGFHLEGDAKLDHSTRARLMTVDEQLSVPGKTSLAQTEIYGSVKLNTPLAADNVDVHLRQSAESKTALRVDKSEGGDASLSVKSGKVGVNTANPESTLDVDGDANIRGTASVTGHFTAKSESYFEQTAYVLSDMAFSVATPAARIHIAEQETDNAALRVDYGSDETMESLVVRQGKLGVGTANPKARLDVKGDTLLSAELQVSGRTVLEDDLDVMQDADFYADVVIRETTKLRDQTIVGRQEEINADVSPNAQFYIADTQYKEALRIDSADYNSVIVVDGKLGIGNESPRVALDVAGEARVTGRAEFGSGLEVDGILQANNDIQVNNNIEGRGKLDISQKATFGSDVYIRGDIYIEDKTDIEEELTVLGATELKNTLTVDGAASLSSTLNVTGDVFAKNRLEVTGSALMKDSLDVAGDTAVQGGLSVNGPFSSGVAQPLAYHHVKVPQGQDAIMYESASLNGGQSLLTLDRQGRMALGKSAAGATLDVNGDARFTEAVNAASLSVTNRISGLDLVAGQSLQINSGQRITGVSTDFRLGGDYAADELLPTQSAVKAYIDAVVVPFGRGGKTYTISSQTDFDNLFNRGESTILDTNTTVLLLPLGNQDYNTTSYVLKNTVQLRSGVSIVGFNEQSTRIVKNSANNRFEVIGTETQPVTDITFTGFTFDGLAKQANQNGGALYLKFVSQCKFNCRFENHMTAGDGGAIYGEMRESVDPYTVSHIEARHLLRCKTTINMDGSDTQRNEGGAVYGVDRSIIYARDCSAEQGGAVARCRASEVCAEGCSASQNGGGAYRSPQIRMVAVDCYADLSTGKGGAAYFCSDMICEGQWVNNNAAEGPHIYASNSLTGEFEERHYWKGDYVGRRIDDGTSVWRTHNE